MKLHALIFLVLFIGLSYSKCPLTRYFKEFYKGECKEDVTNRDNWVACMNNLEYLKEKFYKARKESLLSQLLEDYLKLDCECTSGCKYNITKIEGVDVDKGVCKCSK